MSGSSSAFLNGYLTEREVARLRKQELELSELLELCAQPASLEDRVAAVVRYSSAYPELKYFLIVAYFFPNAFSQLRALGKIDYPPSRVQKGSSVENIKSMWSQVIRMYDSFPTGPKTKRAIAQQLLPALHKDDATLIEQIIEGKYFRKELNDEVVRLAFPKDIPQSPKA